MFSQRISICFVINFVLAPPQSSALPSSQRQATPWSHGSRSYNKRARKKLIFLAELSDPWPLRNAIFYSSTKNACFFSTCSLRTCEFMAFSLYKDKSYIGAVHMGHRCIIFKQNSLKNKLSFAVLYWKLNKSRDRDDFYL